MRIRSLILPALGCLAIAGAALADPLHGRWALDSKACLAGGHSAESAPLTVSDKSIEWFASRCTIRKTYKVGDALHLEARCWTGGTMKDIPVSLVPRGPKLAVTWDRAPAGEMTRCR